MLTNDNNNEQLHQLLDEENETAAKGLKDPMGTSSKWSSATAIEKRNYNKNRLQINIFAEYWPATRLKYGQIRFLMRRKVLLAVLLMLIFGFFVNSALKDNDWLSGEDIYVPVLHQSHVLGMKAPMCGNVAQFDGVMSIALANANDNTSDTYFKYIHNAPSIVNTTTAALPPKGYLVWSDYCKITNLDPYLPEVMRFFKRQKYKPCSKRKPLTIVEFNEQRKLYVLRIDAKVIKDYGNPEKLTCCYAAIERGENDAKVSLSKCINFIKQTELAATLDSVLVKCYIKGKQVYTNGHPLLSEREELRARLNKWRAQEVKAKQRTPSVLMIGIDSVSRVNLIRAMPKTAQYLYDNEWFEMSGYNKMDDNTFPNLMAVLTGFNGSHALRRCNPHIDGGLDNCTFIWDHFRAHGYITAYGEDAAEINTFNYLKKGFTNPPVDYYMRPFLLAAENHLKGTHKSSLVDCLGYKHSAEHVYDYALELAKRYRNDTYFGLFWTNTFSHNDISDCSAMDANIRAYLQKLAKLGTLDSTIVIFFSDHGIRFGQTRKTASGHLEERLPFMFIWLPSYLKQKHPEFVNALSVNKNRLTNPYDLHMTLKHALSLSGRVHDKEVLAPAIDCPRCHSLFMPMQHNRSCTDAAIEDHWCTCIPYESIYKNSKTVEALAKRVIVYINDYVAHFRNGSFGKLCSKLSLHSVTAAYRAQFSSTGSVITYRLLFYTKPNKALYEATVRYNEETDSMEVTGEVSRLTTYAGDSYCVDDSGAKKYCVCKK